MQPTIVVDFRYQIMNSVGSNKIETLTVCKDIGIKIFEFVAKSRPLSL